MKTRAKARVIGATLARWAAVAIGAGAIAACGHAQHEYWGDEPETRTYTLQSGLGDLYAGGVTSSEVTGLSTAHCPDSGSSLLSSSSSSSSSSGGGPSYSTAAVAPRASSSGHTARRGGPPSRSSVAPSRSVSRSISPSSSRTAPRLSR